jgi:hypothetical protein
LATAVSNSPSSALTNRPSLRAVFTKQSSTPAYLPVLSPAGWHHMQAHHKMYLPQYVPASSHPTSTAQGSQALRAVKISCRTCQLLLLTSAAFPLTNQPRWVLLCIPAGLS